MRKECPKCQFALQTPAEGCPACGVIFSKMDQAPAVRPPAPQTFLSRCQACGQNARTALSHFRQNVGMLIARQEKHIEGNMCRACTGKYFWRLTLTTLAVGWLGTVSLIVAPIYVILNIVTYTRSL